MPFLVRESGVPPRASQDPGKELAARRSKEVMEIPEAVEAVTGVNAAYLPVRAVFHILFLVSCTKKHVTDPNVKMNDRNSRVSVESMEAFVGAGKELWANARQGFHVFTWLAACTTGSKMSMSRPLHSERTGEYLQAHLKDQHNPETG